MDLENAPRTAERWQAWTNMGLTGQVKAAAATQWAVYLERRLAELDPNYLSYPFGMHQITKGK